MRTPSSSAAPGKPVCTVGMTALAVEGVRQDQSRQVLRLNRPGAARAVEVPLYAWRVVECNR